MLILLKFLVGMRFALNKFVDKQDKNKNTPKTIKVVFIDKLNSANSFEKAIKLAELAKLEYEGRVIGKNEKNQFLIVI